FVEQGIKKFTYVYDFGDNWRHIIEVEKVLTADAGVEYPRCVEGKRACPPEDCAGSWGYGDVVKAVKNPSTKNRELVEWVGEDFDREEFYLEEVNKDLAAMR